MYWESNLEINKSFAAKYLDEYIGNLKGVCLIQSIDEIYTSDLYGVVLIKNLISEPYRATFFKPFDSEVEAISYRKMLVNDLHGYWLFESHYDCSEGEEYPIHLLDPNFEKLPEEFVYWDL